MNCKAFIVSKMIKRHINSPQYQVFANKASQFRKLVRRTKII